MGTPAHAVRLSESIDVFIVAENRLLREALAKVLGRKSEIRVVGAAACGSEIAQQVAHLHPHVLLVDSAALASSGMHTLARIHNDVSGVKVLAIGMEDDKETFLRCVRSGLAGYVLKDASALEVATAVRGVAIGEAICPPSLCLALFECVARSACVPSFFAKLSLGLSRREQQLISMIGAGLTNKEIASQLNLSDQTVRNHVHRILRKLGVRDRLAAAELCRQQGLVAQ